MLMTRAEAIDVCCELQLAAQEYNNKQFKRMRQKDLLKQINFAIKNGRVIEPFKS